MDRRTLLLAFAGIAIAPDGGPRAQAPAVHVVGVLASGSAAAERKRVDDFARGMIELGYVEGRNLRLEQRYAEGRFEALPALAADLLERKVGVIVCLSTLATQAASKATRSVPIVFATVADPVAEGFAASLARPGGNVTGISNLGTALAGKLLQVLKESFPGVTRVVVLTAPRAPHAAAQLVEVETAARVLQLAILPLQLRRRDEIEAALGRVRAWHGDAIYVMQGAENSAVRDVIVEFASSSRLPAVYPQRNYAEAGGLISYGSDFDANYHRAATYVDRILKGARPGDLAIEQPTRFELVVNLATARALGLAIPQSVLVRADRVIQ